jgi:hypothetical protein
MFDPEKMDPNKLTKNARKIWDQTIAAAKREAEIKDNSTKELKSAWELGKEAAASMYDYLHLGTKDMKAMLDRIEGIATYEPPVLKMGTFAAVKKRLGVLAKREGAAGNIGVSALDAAQTAEGLLQKAAAGRISPNELVILNRAISQMGVAGHYMQQVMPGLMGKKLMKNFRKNVAKSVAEFGSEENLAYNRELMMMTRGHRLSKGETFIEGWDVKRGGYPRGPQQMWQRPWMAKRWAGLPEEEAELGPTKMRWGRTSFAGAQAFAAAREMSKKSVEEMRLKQSKEIGDRMNKALQDVLSQLRVGTLKVQVISGDPLGGGGSAGSAGRSIFD